MKYLFIISFMLHSLLANDIYGLNKKEQLQAYSDFFYKQQLQSNNIETPPILSKGEFETQKMFEERVKKSQIKYNDRINTLGEKRKHMQNKSLEKAMGIVYGQPTIGALNYDAEKEYFYTSIGSSKGGFEQDIAIKVSRKYARDFKLLKDTLQPEVVYDIDNDILRLKKVQVMFQGKKFVASLETNNFMQNEISISLNKQTNIRKSKQVFDDIPILLEKVAQHPVDKKRWIFAVGIENYDFTDSVQYASNSARMFVKVMQKKYGVDATHTKLLVNNEASSAKLNYHLRDLLHHVKPGDTIYFYYAGHGVPLAKQDNEPYILPQDVSIDYLEEYSQFKLQNIYRRLSKSKASKVIAIVDSCFSGGSDGKTLFKGVAATRLKAKKVTFDPVKMLVLSASRDKQYANMYADKKHRLFSYYILKEIISGGVTARELYKGVRSDVKDKSYEFGTTKEQEPVFEGNIDLKF